MFKLNNWLTVYTSKQNIQGRLLDNFHAIVLMCCDNSVNKFITTLLNPNINQWTVDTVLQYYVPSLSYWTFESSALNAEIVKLHLDTYMDGL